ncbi:hypothetical protein D3C80_1113530 [compost metagenome]
MARRIIAYILLGVGLLILMFFRDYKGTMISFPFIYSLCGLLLCVLGCVLLYLQKKRKALHVHNQYKETIEDIMQHGQKVKVDLNQCEIRENNYCEERERYAADGLFATLSVAQDIQALNLLTNATRNVENVQVNQSVIIFHYDYGGRLERFVSPVLPIDRTTLLLKLGRQKETTLYIDHNNTRRYYFDLEFLFES